MDALEPLMEAALVMVVAAMNSDSETTILI